MSEPEPLRRGKEFQRTVQSDFIDPSGQGNIKAEFETIIPFRYRDPSNNKHGRADIVLSDQDGVVAVLEIKATIWDQIKPENVHNNLRRHIRQLLSYIDKFLEIDQRSVCPGIIYPEPPSDPKLRNTIEVYLEERGVPAYWFNEIKLQGHDT